MSIYVVTGCSRGLGLALVESLASMPASKVSTVFATSRGSSAGPKLSEIIKSSGGRVVHVALDVGSQQSIEKAVETITKTLDGKGVDVLINNAAILESAPTSKIWEMTELPQAFSTNVMGVQNVTIGFLPLMRKGTEKKIVNLSTTLGSLGLAHAYFSLVPLPAYKISKAAMNMLTIQWANDLKDEGFTVLPITPGHNQTDLGTMGGTVKADLPAMEGAAYTLDIIQNARVDDSGRFRNINVKGWPNPEHYNGKDVLW